MVDGDLPDSVTGGLEAEAFPTSGQLARAIRLCIEAQLPFKATAGLHQPLRHHDAAVGADAHGFFNLFFAAAATQAMFTVHLFSRWGEPGIVEILDQRSPEAFVVLENTIRGGGFILTEEYLAQSPLLRSFGSCSFEEPLEGLRSLGFL